MVKHPIKGLICQRKRVPPAFFPGQLFGAATGHMVPENEMKNAKIGSNSKLLFQVVGLFLLGAAAVLGIFQYRWVTQASAAEEERLRNSLRLSTRQAVVNTVNEVNVLLSLAYLEPKDLADRNWEKIHEAVSFWHEGTRFPQLLKSIHVLPPSGSEEVVQLYPTGPESAVSKKITSIGSALSVNEISAELLETIRDLSRNGVTFLAIPRRPVG